MTPSIRALVFAAFAIGTLPVPSAAQNVAAEFVAGGFDLPVQVTAPAGDPRLFVVEQTGAIRIVDDPAAGTVRPTPFLDLSSEVQLDFLQEDERGLLSLAFAPDYATSGFFFVLIATTSAVPPDVDGRIEVRRYQVGADPNVANPSTAKRILGVPHPPRVQPGTLEYYHNGGTVAFASDAKLWVSIGDGAGWFGNDPNNCAQDARSPLGKLLEIDLARVPRDGVIVPFGSPCPHLPAGNAVRVFGVGLRNPWRFSFDRAAGDLYIGDVGQDTTEEVDVVAASALAGPSLNFGWRAWEGSAPNDAVCPGDPLCSAAASVTFPIHTYGHPFEFCSASVTGGFVYRGSNPALQGRYLFADFCQGFFRALVWDGGGGTVGPVEDLTTQIDPFGQIPSPVSFGEDGAGELHIVDLGFGGDGAVYRIPVPEPGALPWWLVNAGGLLGLARRRERAARRSRSGWTGRAS